ncbi:hypothetical protein M378DRAFT_310312 [Amanita muscaria Koide BX008]|uniref:Uncharacterized protein n=1 Tax=Amanita muscaria (strain Koide BX008) TaxID=946122 RepID=A0A0C2SX26_AMAMK|nr:hypothetical protein M378DRAFT_310312 [Amanita muscaria Koide BX008]
MSRASCSAIPNCFALLSSARRDWNPSSASVLAIRILLSASASDSLALDFPSNASCFSICCCACLEPPPSSSCCLSLAFTSPIFSPLVNGSRCVSCPPPSLEFRTRHHRINRPTLMTWASWLKTWCTSKRWRKSFLNLFIFIINAEAYETGRWL